MGPVVGRRLAWRGRSIDEFLGVPYAAPPLGPNRWRPPQPLTPWTAPRDATSMPPACPQNPPQSHVRVPAFPDQEPRAPWSEDCLVVNVWAPSNRSRLLPVLLWLYGGGWQEGDAAQPLYNGRNLTSAQDVVLVVVNWRVNAFGFLGMRALAAEEEKLSGQATTGFYGQQDQRAAMVWARDNIKKFGGDPQKVTLWGQSAGAGSVCYHLLLPRSKGLFQRAIVDSSCDEPSLSAGGRPTPAAAPYGIASHWGCAETNLTCLRSIPAAELNAFVNVDYRASPMVHQKWFYPLWDSSEFPAGSSSMVELWSGGNFSSHVPCMFGSTLEEQGWEFCGDQCRGEWGSPFNVSVPPSEYERVFRAALAGQVSPALLEELVVLYALGTRKADSLPLALAMLLTDVKDGMGSCTGMNRDTATVTRFGMRAFNYVVARRPAAQPGYVGACHGTEQPFVFGNPRWMWWKEQAYTAEEEALSSEMQAAWVRFADSGDPGWPAWGAGGKNSTRVFDTNQSAADAVVVNYNEERCAVWRRHPPTSLSWTQVEKNVYAALAPPGPPAPPGPAPAPAPVPGPAASADNTSWMMGWNSWDALGTAVNETSFLEHCEYMAIHLLRHGYDHCLLDAGWSAQGPAPENALVDPHGRPLPNPALWPSAGVDGSLGFGPLAAKVHKLGLKFGFHVWRGVLPAAVAARSPIKGAPGYTAADIVMAEHSTVPGYNDDTCRRDAFSRGVNTSHPAAQAWHDSLAELWTEWHADAVKVDCNRLKWVGARQEVFMLADALEKAAKLSRRPILYELSPGGNSVCGSGCGECNGPHQGKKQVYPCNPALNCNASVPWRVSLFRMDHGVDGRWINGSWVIPTEFTVLPASSAPALSTAADAAAPRVRLGDVHDRWRRDIINQFPVAAAWAAHRFGPATGEYSGSRYGLYGKRARAYIDMLPVGEMSSNAPRGNKMSFSQQQVAFTLWAVLGSPLVLGTALVRMSAETLALVTNAEVIRMAKTAASTRQLWWDGVPCAGAVGKSAGVPCAATTAWEVTMPAPNSTKYYALFNLGPSPRSVTVEGAGAGSLFDVWRRQPNGTTSASGSIQRTVAANSTLLLRLS